MKMKLAHLFVGMGLVLASCSSNDKLEMGQRTTMEVDKVIEIGNVMKGEVAKASIVIKNTGKYPLIISEAKGSCSCTVINAPTEPIAPGESATFKADINTDNASTGPMAKSVNITANTQPSDTEIIIKANVIRK